MAYDQDFALCIMNDKNKSFESSLEGYVLLGIY